MGKAAAMPPTYITIYETIENTMKKPLKNTFPQLEFLKKIKLFNFIDLIIYIFYIIGCTSRDTLCLILWMNIIRL